VTLGVSALFCDVNWRNSVGDPQPLAGIDGSEEH
jgi:hypothetical protein